MVFRRKPKPPLAQAEKLVQDATALAMADVPVIMLHLQKNIWATRKGLVYEPRTDEDTRAMGVHPAAH